MSSSNKDDENDFKKQMNETGMTFHSGALISGLARLFRNAEGSRESINDDLMASFGEGALQSIDDDFDDAASTTAEQHTPSGAAINSPERLQELTKSSESIMALESPDQQQNDDELDSNWRQNANASLELANATTLSKQAQKKKTLKVLAKVFKIEERGILEVTTGQLLLASLLPCHLCLTKTHFHIFAALEPAVSELIGKSGYVGVKRGSLISNLLGSRRWLVLGDEALSGYKSSDQKDMFAPLFRIPYSVIKDVRAISHKEFELYTTPSSTYTLQKELFETDSNDQLHAWVLAIRTMVVCHRRVAFKRSIPLANITSVHVPQSEVFDRSLSLRANGKLMFLTAIDDMDAFASALGAAWLEALTPDSPRGAAMRAANMAPAPTHHDEQQRFTELFKLGQQEQLVETFDTAVKVGKHISTISGRMYLSKNYVCFNSASKSARVLLICAWRDISDIAVSTASFFWQHNGIAVTIKERRIVFLFSKKLFDEVKDRMQTMWRVAPVMANVDAQSGTHRRSQVDIPVDNNDDDDAFDLTDFDYDSDEDDVMPAADSSSWASISPTPPSPLTPQIHTDVSVKIQESFKQIPITEKVLHSFSCSLFLSDRFHAGQLHILDHFICFIGNTMHRALAPLHCIDNIETKAKVNILTLYDEDEHQLVFGRFGNGVNASQAKDVIKPILRNVNEPTEEIKQLKFRIYHNRIDRLSRKFSLEDQYLLDTFECSMIHHKIPRSGELFVTEKLVAFAGGSLTIVVPLSDLSEPPKRERHAYLLHDVLQLTTALKSFRFIKFLHHGLRRCLRLVTRLQKQHRHASTHELVSEPSSGGGSTAPEAPRDSRRTFDALALPNQLGSPPPLHVVLLTIGSRGDVQPLIALGLRLRRDGHTVTIATHGEFKDFVEKYSLKFRLLSGDPKVLMELCVGNGMFTPAFLKKALKEFTGFVDDLMNSAWDACQGADVIISAPTVFGVSHVAEKLAKPFLYYFTMPFTPTKAFPSPFALTNSSMGPGFNYLSHAMIDQAMFQPVFSQINEFRKRIGLHELSRMTRNERKAPFLYCFSKALCPPPSDWRSMIHVVGFWFLDQALQGRNEMTLQGDNSPMSSAREPSSQRDDLDDDMDDSHHSHRRHRHHNRHHHHHRKHKHDEKNTVDDNDNADNSDNTNNNNNNENGNDQCSGDESEDTERSKLTTQHDSNQQQSVAAQVAKHPSLASVAKKIQSSYEPPEDLVKFIAKEKPIYVGFGSITGISNQQQFIDNVIKAIELSKQRCILLTGWAKITENRELPDCIFPLDSVPHDWLFPQMKAVVHHGGAGTVAAGLRASCPTVVVAFFGDQHFWGSRIEKMGVGKYCEASDIASKGGAEQLASAIEACAENKDVAAAAEHISEVIREERGLDTAARLIYDQVMRGQRMTERVLALGDAIADMSHSGSHSAAIPLDEVSSQFDTPKSTSSP